MNDFSRKLLALALVAALPSLGCFSYYTVESADLNNGIPTPLFLLSYPLLLISLAAVIASRFSKKPSRLGLWLAGICLIASAGVLLWAWL